jgi:hypothetical protein
MEISDPDLIKSLLADLSKPRRTHARKPDDVYEAPTGKGMRRNCRCGRCDSCLTNIRWEKIFKEKFADPDYNSRPPKGGSSLNRP